MDRFIMTKTVHADDLKADLTEVKIEQHTRSYILMIIGGILLPDKWNYGSSYARLMKELRDIQLLLNHRSEAKDLTIRECIPSEFLVNPNIWYVNVPLVVYDTIEIHESNSVLRQFEFRQSILVEFLPPCKAIVAPGLASDLEYRPWFRLFGKPYLLSEEDRSGQPHTKRPRRPLEYPRSGEAGSSSTPMQEPTLTPLPTPLGQYVSSYFGAYENPRCICHPCFGHQSKVQMPLVYRTQYSYTPKPMVAQTPPRSLFYPGSSSSQPPNID
ncbi:hypothetical protein Gotri_006131 [Gossypium trilobum]|uniref:Uncharacterized protein n=1 Tax=Gossypium trilobum TaxID=34281 RepID=A0A7J9EZ18_9ROSI|nr:hypothetical protein [Gossypium trilobum]